MVLAQRERGRSESAGSEAKRRAVPEKLTSLAGDGPGDAGCGTGSVFL